MNLFLSSFGIGFLEAAQQPSAGDALFQTVIMFGLIFGIFYFLLIRPQQKKQKEHQAMLDALKRGDEVVTAGGIHGVVKAVTPQTAKIEIAQGVVIVVDKAQIAVRKSGSDSESNGNKKS